MNSYSVCELSIHKYYKIANLRKYSYSSNH